MLQDTLSMWHDFFVDRLAHEANAWSKNLPRISEHYLSRITGKKIIDHRWRVAFWMTCHTQVRLCVSSISSLFIIIILLTEFVFPIECFKVRNTCCLCMTYCNSLLWFYWHCVCTIYFIKYFVYFIILPHPKSQKEWWWIKRRVYP
jgi:hypothetical protein